MAGYYDQSDDGEDDGLGDLRQIQQAELASKQQQFEQQQGMKQRAYQLKIAGMQDNLQATQAGRIAQFHGQNGDDGLRTLAHHMTRSFGPQHVAAIAQHLYRMGAGQTANLMLQQAQASSAMNQGQQHG